MNQVSPTLNDFMVVESLAHHNSISLSAKELGLSPSALSRQLSSIESKLGVRLFERDTRNSTLTPIGLEFIQIAKKVLIEMDEYLNCLNLDTRTRLNQLKISAIPSVTGVLLPRLLSGFTSNYPDVNFMIIDQRTPDVVEAIENGQVDLAITTGTVTIRTKLSFIPFFKENFLILSSKEDSTMDKDEYSLQEIIEMPIISAVKGTTYRDYIDSICDREKLYFSPRIEVTQLDTAVALVTEGFGITILPTLILPIIFTEKLKFHRLSEFSLPNEIGIAFSSNRSLSHVANNFLNHVKLEIHDLYQSIRKEYAI